MLRAPAGFCYNTPMDNRNPPAELISIIKRRGGPGIITSFLHQGGPLKTSLSRILSPLTLTLILAWPAPARAGLVPQQPGTKPPVIDLAAVLAKVEKLTGLAHTRDIPMKTMTRDDVRAYLIRQMEEEMPAGLLEEEERLYRTLGLLPAGLDLKAFLLDLYTEQAGGFYDPKTGYYVLAGWLDPVMQEPVMAHELIHALQDQVVPMTPMLERIKRDDDLSSAVMAVAEGSATLGMIACALGIPVDQLAKSESLDGFIKQMTTQSGEGMPVFQRAPRFLKESLLFPYLQGTRFATALTIRRGFPAFLDYLRQFPPGTVAICQPEKYLDGKLVVEEVALTVATEICPQPRERSGGYFLLEQFLKEGLDPAKASALLAGYTGDRLVTASVKSPASPVWWKIQWEKPGDMIRFRDALAGWQKPGGTPVIRIEEAEGRTILLRIGPPTQERKE